jgi:hypothetical protein
LTLPTAKIIAVDRFTLDGVIQGKANYLRKHSQ